MNKILVVVSMMLFASSAFADPAITGTSGTLINGQSYTINGSGYGTKSTGAPIEWDTFECGTNGADVVGTHCYGSTDWGLYDGSGVATNKYSNASAHSGSLSMASTTLSDAAFQGVNKYNLTGDTVYYSIWFRYDQTAGNQTGDSIGKFIRLGGYPDLYTTRPSFWWTIFTGEGIQAACIVSSDGDAWDVETLAYFDTNGPIHGSVGSPSTWGRAEVLLHLGTAGVANGFGTVWWNGVKVLDRQGYVTRASSDAGKGWDGFELPFMHDEHSPGNRFISYTDDVYVDNTPQRVEICSGSTWVAKGHCEVQPATAWNATSATVTVNRGSFASDASAYLYVVDASNVANSTGTEVKFGAGAAASHAISRGVKVTGGVVR